MCARMSPSPSTMSLGTLLSTLITSSSSSSSSSRQSPPPTPALIITTAASGTVTTITATNTDAICAAHSHRVRRVPSRQSSPLSSYPRKRTVCPVIIEARNSVTDPVQRPSQPVSASVTPRLLTPPPSPPNMLQKNRPSSTSKFDAWLQRAKRSSSSNGNGNNNHLHLHLNHCNSNIDSPSTSPFAALPLSPLLSPSCDAHTSDSIRQQYEYALDDMVRSATSPTVNPANTTVGLSLFRSGATSPGGCKSPGSAVTSLTDMPLAERHLRRLALVHPIPVGHDDLRRRLWRTLLAREGNFTHLQCLYVSLKARGLSSMHSQIQHDLATLAQSDRLSVNATDSKEQSTSLMESLTRILNAFVHQMQDELDDTKNYVQGLHWIALAFLEVLPEEDAFASLYLFITRCAPVYARTTMDGVQCAVELMDECLRILDRPLYDHLLDHGIFPERYAYNALLSFTGCHKSISKQDHLRLWDAFLAYGIHINVLCVVAQLIKSRDMLLATDQPLNILSRGLDGDIYQTINDALSLSQQLPSELYDILTRHANDPNVRHLLPLTP